MIYITGSNGFIGRNYIDFLKKKNLKFYCLERRKKLGKNNKSSYVKFPKINLNNKNILVYLASSSVVKLHRKKVFLPEDVLNCLENEIDSIISLIKFYKKNNFKKFIYISTSSVYGKRKYSSPFKETDELNPTDFYSQIKMANEMLIKKEVKNYIILRPFQIYGKYDNKRRLIPTLVKAKKNKILKLQDCLQVTDIIHVNDVCEVIYNLGNSKVRNETYNLGSGKPIGLRTIVKTVSKIKDNYFKYRFNKINQKTISNYCYANTDKLKSIIKFKVTKFPKSNHEIY